MKKIYSKLCALINRNRKTHLFLWSLLVIGIITGSFFIVLLDKTDKLYVSNQITNFFSNVKTGENLNYWTALVNAIVSNFSICLIIWLLGISVIGIPIVLFILFSKGFILGFSIGAIIYKYKISGLLLSLVYTTPHIIINTFLIMVISYYSFMFSMNMVVSLIKKKNLTLKSGINKYLKVLTICLAGFLLTSLFEVFVTPKLLKFFGFLIK